MISRFAFYVFVTLCHPPILYLPNALLYTVYSIHTVYPPPLQADGIAQCETNQWLQRISIIIRDPDTSLTSRNHPHLLPHC